LCEFQLTLLFDLGESGQNQRSFMPCFYVPFLSDDTKPITISGDEFHHIAHVFRYQVGDEIQLTSGKGLLGTAKITSLDKRQLTAEILDICRKEKSSPRVAAAIPLLKNKHDALIVEKLTELGVSDFFPILTERSVRQASANTIDKLEKIAIAAIKQCDNAFLPQIHPAQTLVEFLENPAEFQPLVALESGKNIPLTLILKQMPPQPLCFIIGPEGGFSEKEVKYFKEKQIPTFTLGNHILRAETAAIATAAQIIGFFLEKNESYY